MAGVLPGEWGRSRLGAQLHTRWALGRPDPPPQATRLLEPGSWWRLTPAPVQYFVLKNPGSTSVPTQTGGCCGVWPAVSKPQPSPPICGWSLPIVGHCQPPRTGTEGKGCSMFLLEHFSGPTRTCLSCKMQTTQRGFSHMPYGVPTPGVPTTALSMTAVSQLSPCSQKWGCSQLPHTLVLSLQSWVLRPGAAPVALPLASRLAPSQLPTGHCS